MRVEQNRRDLCHEQFDRLRRASGELSSSDLRANQDDREERHCQLNQTAYELPTKKSYDRQLMKGEPNYISCFDFAET